MGNKRSGILSLPNKFLTKKGTPRKKIGKPKLDFGIEFVIYAKIKQISKGRKLTMWKAWEQLTNHSNFAFLMKPHFQKMKKYKVGPSRSAWRKLIKDPDWKKNFYKNHLKKSQLIKRFNKIKFTYEE
jgi:hypothetical protein